MRKNKETVIENNVDSMIEYMSEKYNDVFEYAGYFGDSYADTPKSICVKSAKYPGNEISVCYHESNGEAYITENYTQLRFKDEAEAFATDLLKNFFGTDVFVSCSVSTQGTRNSFSEETTFKEFVADRASDINFGVVVSDEFKISDMEELVGKVKSVIADSSMVASGEILFASSSEYFKPYYELKFYEKQELHRIFFMMDEKNSFSTIRWW